MDKNKQLIQKSGAVESQELTDEELEKINKFHKEGQENTNPK